MNEYSLSSPINFLRTIVTFLLVSAISGLENIFPRDRLFHGFSFSRRLLLLFFCDCRFIRLKSSNNTPRYPIEMSYKELRSVEPTVEASFPLRASYGFNFASYKNNYRTLHNGETFRYETNPPYITALL